MDIEDLRPHCPAFGTSTQRLEKGKTYLYCTCGLTKHSFECDSECVGTAFEGKALPFTVKKDQTMFSICQCRYSKSIPYCDASHIHLPCDYIERQQNCTKPHDGKICPSCGFANK